MKIFGTVLLLSTLVVVSLATPDWDAIEAKYNETEASWQEEAEKCEEIMAGELDAETLKSASHVLHTMLRRETASSIKTLYLDIQFQTLTARQVEFFYGNFIYEQEMLLKKDLEPFKAMMSQKGQEKLEQLFDDFFNYRIEKIQEIIQLVQVGRIRRKTRKNIL